MITEGNGSIGLFRGQRFIDETAMRLPDDNDDRSFEGDFGDVDGDGDIDLFIANGFVGENKLFINDGKAIFKDETSLRLPQEDVPSEGVQFGDIDMDRDMDIVVSNIIGDSFIYFNNGSGIFNRVAIHGGLFTRDARLIDADRDGRPDIIFANSDPTGGIGSGDQNRLFMNHGSGVFLDETSTRLPQLNDSTSIVRVGDVNRDGATDILFFNFGLSQHVRLLFNDGAGHFTDVTEDRLPFRQGSLGGDLGDADGDGDLDIILAISSVTGDTADIIGPAQNLIWINDGTGGFTDQTADRLPILLDESVDAIFADIDRDGDNDIVVANADIRRYPDVRGAQNHVLINQGSGFFSDKTSSIIPALQDRTISIKPADIDADGDMDLFVANVMEQSRILINKVQGQGSFVSPAGDFSELILNPDSTFTRTLKDGTQINFDSNGFHISTVDRNGNATVYSYDIEGRLARITDPAGMITTLSYIGNRLASITDPVGRITTFEHDLDGNLINITDLDGSRRQFSYDTRHRLVSQISKRGFTANYAYKFGGRNVQVSRPDGSVNTIIPAETVGLVDYILSGGFALIIAILCSISSYQNIELYKIIEKLLHK